MKIELKRIKIRDVAKGYYNNDKTNEVMGYDNKLSIRPPFQREFVYNDNKRDKVIVSILKGYPLNVLYWIKSGKDIYGNDKFEMLDGQQRTISFCEYIINHFYIKYEGFNEPKFFANLSKEYQDRILNYELLIYFCEGTDQEILNWFKIINIAGEKLTNQELRNAIYTGKWLYSAKEYFSKRNCPAYELGHRYLSGTPIRQDYLETVLRWISNNKIELYMSQHQHEDNAKELWDYFELVINWTKKIFPYYNPLMKGTNFGYLYNEFRDKEFDIDKLTLEINELIDDEDVDNKKGIWDYVISRNEKKLNIRAFTPNHKAVTYKKQNGFCIKCNKHFESHEMVADHIKPWSKGGKTNLENCQLLCKHCNAVKSDKY